MNIELHILFQWGFPNSRKVPQNHNEKGDPKKFYDHDHKFNYHTHLGPADAGGPFLSGLSPVTLIY